MQSSSVTCLVGSERASSPTARPDSAARLKARPRKIRSFTLSQPPVTKSRAVKKPIKRSKTFTGCWTCRSRGLKCDEKRPACEKCLRSNLSCEGYHVKLVWDGDGENESGKTAKRRTFLIDQSARQPVLTSREIHLALEELDAIEPGVAQQTGPFTVFPALPLSEEPHANTNPSEATCYDKTRHSSPEGPDLALDYCAGQGFYGQVEHPQLHGADMGLADRGEERGQPSPGENEIIKNWVNGSDGPDNESIEAAMIMTSIKEKLLPQFTSYLSSSTLEERSLLHYWVTVLSGLMIPTQRHDNPFRTIFLPLALTRPDSSPASSGNAALLHAIYSVSAFNLAQLSPSSDRLITLGTKHHKLALGHLRRNLMQPEETQREAILATIITMSSIEVIKGDSSSWRTHLSGGRILLQSLMNQGVLQSSSATVLCQIFFCINTLAVSSVPSAAYQNVLQLADRSTDRQSCEQEMQWPIWHTAYALDKLFGITKPVLEAIVRINALSNPANNATLQEIHELELHIRRSDPDMLVAGLDGYDDITRHHTCAFFCACLIHFERRLRKTSSKRIQRVVQRGLDHLEAIRSIETQRNLDVCGIFWPEFVTACEAEEANNMRARAICLFDKGNLRGIGNIQSAEQVVLEVWRQRDTNVKDKEINWDDVQCELGLDLILI